MNRRGSSNGAEVSRRLQVVVQCAIDARNTTGESPLWSARDAVLYRVDIPDGVIHYWQPETGQRRLWRLPAAVGSIGLRESGGLVVAMRSGFHLFDLSPDGRTMYHSDSRGGAIFRHAYDPQTGAIGRRELFVQMHPEWGRPDGGATDEEGCYWSCGVSAGRINRFSPDGELVEFVQMPIEHPTMPCFGGPAGRTMYVTSHRENYSAEELARTPQAGGVFMLEPGVAGAPAAFYQG